MNGEVFVRDGVIYHRQDGNESEVIAARYLYTTNVGDALEWRLELKDGSTVQWSMNLRSYGMENLCELLQIMSDERPVAEPVQEARWRFGINPQETADTLRAIADGMGNTHLVQMCTEAVMTSTEDFEIKSITVIYSEKK